MNAQPDAIKTALLNMGIDVSEVDYKQRGFHLEAGLDASQVRNFAQKMYAHGFYLVFVTGFHVQPEETGHMITSGLQVVYQFARHDRLYRVKGQVSLPEDKTVPSICDIYHGANWHERETRDMYGVVFSGHPNLKPLLLTDEDQDFHPLLKTETTLKSLAAVSWQPATEDSVDDASQSIPENQEATDNE